MEKGNIKPEILSPAGNRESFFAAINNGADAVYLGGEKFSLRSMAKNFTLDEIKKMVKSGQIVDAKTICALYLLDS